MFVNFLQPTTHYSVIIGVLVGTITQAVANNGLVDLPMKF